MTGRTAVPGDLGRRIARRREDLGLGRDEPVRRAGIDPGCLAYPEESVNRVAAALAAPGIRPWAGGRRKPYGRIAAAEFAGRRIRRGA